MIGLNDTGRVSLCDARALVGSRTGLGLGRVSMSSPNADAPCGVQPADGEQVSNTCSGIAQRPLAFTWELGRLDTRRLRARRACQSKDQPCGRSRATIPPPVRIPIWRPRKTYQLTTRSSGTSASRGQVVDAGQPPGRSGHRICGTRRGATSAPCSHPTHRRGRRSYARGAPISLPRGRSRALRRRDLPCQVVDAGQRSDRGSTVDTPWAFVR